MNPPKSPQWWLGWGALLLFGLICNWRTPCRANWSPDISGWDYAGAWRDLIFLRQPDWEERLGAYRKGDLLFLLRWDQFEAMYPMKYQYRNRIPTDTFQDRTQDKVEASPSDPRIPYLTADGSIIYK